MFKKILIANRGEIARRIIRSARKLGVQTVAVFSDADAHLPFVHEADESHYLGPSPAADSYLQGDRIIEFAQRHGAEGIHPGYGFLAENADFAKACEDAGVKFIGPSSKAIHGLGDKRNAKAVSEAADVPVTPWIRCSGQADAETKAAVDKIGYPVMIKPAAGGGGKGMHRADNETELAELLPKAAREAKASFGDDALLVEKFLETPKHIEVQILADEHGHVVHLFERECSLQRRHQKLMEETPSPSLTAEQREEICADAVAIAREAGYSNAGTCEFLFDHQAGSWYFCEVNTRLQVEHPVTEAVTGIDLVEWQLRIASGEKLALQQSELKQEGHAVELRINSEDPYLDFMPSLGLIEAFEIPEGDGIRVDAGFAVGDSITQFYDSLMAKLIVHDIDRNAAFDKAIEALKQMQVVGLRTTIPFQISLLSHPEVRAGKFDIHWVEHHFDELKQRNGAGEAAILAALMEYRHLLKLQRAQAKASELHFSPWRASALPRMG